MRPATRGRILAGWRRTCQVGMRWQRRGQQTYQRFSQDDGFLMAAAVAYYAAVAFFPLILLLIAGVGLFLRFTDVGRSAEQQVLLAVAEYGSPALQQDVETLLEQVQRNAAVGGPLGILGLLLTALILFAQFQRAFDRIWNVESPTGQGWLRTLRDLLVHRLRAFLMLLGLGGLILLTFLTGLVLSLIQAHAPEQLPLAHWAWHLLQTGASLLLDTAVFTLIYKILPKVPVQWAEAFRGAILTAVVWELGRLVLTTFLTGGGDNAYGLIGSFLAVMLWAYYAAAVVFLGAEYIQVLRQERVEG